MLTIDLLLAVPVHFPAAAKATMRFFGESGSVDLILDLILDWLIDSARALGSVERFGKSDLAAETTLYVDYTRLVLMILLVRSSWEV